MDQCPCPHLMRNLPVETVLANEVVRQVAGLIEPHGVAYQVVVQLGAAADEQLDQVYTFESNCLLDLLPHITS